MPDMIKKMNDDADRPEEDKRALASSDEDRKPAAKASFGVSDDGLATGGALDGAPSSISGSSIGKRKEAPDSAERTAKKVRMVASKSATASRGKSSATKGSSSGSSKKPPSSPHSSPETKKKIKSKKTSLSVKPGLAHFPTRRKGFIDDSEVPEHETAEEKKRRLNRNNERRKRARRVFKIDHFTEEKKKLDTANAKLKKDNQVLRERIAALRENLQAGGGPGRFAAATAAAQILQDQARDAAQAGTTTTVAVDANPPSRPRPSSPEAVLEQQPSSSTDSFHPAAPQDVRPQDHSSPTLFPSPGSNASVPPSTSVLDSLQRERALHGAIQQLQGRASTGSAGAQLSSSLGHLGASPLNAASSILAQLQQQHLLMQQLQQQQTSADPFSSLLRLRQQERLEIQRELLRHELREQDLLSASAGLRGAARQSLAAPSPSPSLDQVQELLSNSSANDISAATLQRLLALSRGSINQTPLSPSTAASLLGSQRSGASSLAASHQPTNSTTSSLLFTQLQQQLSGADRNTALRQSLPGTNVGGMSLQNMSFNATSAAQRMQASNSTTLMNNLPALGANPFAGAASRFFGQGSPIGSGGLDRPAGAAANFLHPAPSAEEAALLFNLARDPTAGTQQHPSQLSSPFQGDSKMMDSIDEEEGKTSNSSFNFSREDGGDKKM